MPNGGFDASRVGSGDRSNGTASTSYGRFELSITPALRQLLKDASTDDTLPQVCSVHWILGLSRRPAAQKQLGPHALT